jgi:L-ascorbate metabolism protein UlaG (beta-lactamase superfamily)
LKFLFLILFISNLAFGLAPNERTLSVKWTSVAGVLVSDGVTDLGFDLLFTKPNLKHWFFNAQFLPNVELLEKKVKEYEIKKLEGLFVSHTHCDHAIDLPWFSAQFSAPLYGSISMQRIANAYSKITNRAVIVKDMRAKEPIIIGDFKITAFPRTHAPILQSLGWHFLEGDVPENTNLNFYDYATGDTWSYLVEHPKGNIYIDQGGQPNDDILNALPKIDMAVLGTANKKSLEHWVNGYGKKMNPKIAMPVHYDWFFLSWPEDPFIMPRMELDEIAAEFKGLGIQFQKDKITF